MAIIVEEVKPPRNLGMIIGTIAVVVIVFIGVYFLFFKKPVLIEMTIPTSVKTTQELSQLQFNPLDIQNNEVFQTLRQYSPLPTAGELGRPNPFLPY